MQLQPTDAGVLFRLVYEAMHRAQMPAAQILQRVGIVVDQIEHASRTKSSAQVAFWQAAEAITQDADVGLHIGEFLPLYRGQVLEYLLLSSATFGDGLARLLSYQRLVSDSIGASLVVDDTKQVCYLMQSSSGLNNHQAHRHFTECFLMGMLRFFRSVTEGTFAFIHLELDYAQGASPIEYRRLFGCDVSFGSDAVKVHFDPSVLKLKLWQAEADLLKFHEQIANVKLKELARRDLLSEIRRVIASNLESTELTLEVVATELGIDARRLRSQLSESNTSFKQILADYRCRLAKRLLTQTNESIEQIVYLTGFSEPSTFYRAFKRWTDETPVEYRKRHQYI